MPTIVYQGQEYLCREEENILVALLRQGIELKHSCRAGVCNACTMKVIGEDGTPLDQSMLESGALPGESLKVGGLPEGKVATGHFLACKTRVKHRLAMTEPDEDKELSYGLVAGKRWLNDDVMELTLDPAYNPDYKPGQFVNLYHPNGSSRPYSLASSPTSHWSMIFHIRRHNQGLVSRWLSDEVQVGDSLKISMPEGGSHLSEGMTHVVMLGFGVGLAPLQGMTQQVLDGGTSVDQLLLVHLGRGTQGLYSQELLTTQDRLNPNFEYIGLTERSALFSEKGVFETRLDALASESGVHWFVCGNPEAVSVTGERLKAQGVDEQRIYFDPFDDTSTVAKSAVDSSRDAAEPRQRTEGQPYPDTQPELWHWLEQDNRLGGIITDFYQRIFNDDIMLPYFHNSTQQRSREKVYSFYKRLFSGEPCFFGDRPRNAHHWMVITDAIYDHRLALLESTLRDHNVPEHLLKIWMGYEEYYRSDIVKDEPRGRQMGDITQPAGGFGRETLTCGAICDSCESIIEAGENVLYHLRTGQLYCKRCEGKQSEN